MLTARFQGERLRDGEEFQEIAANGEAIRDGEDFRESDLSQMRILNRSAVGESWTSSVTLKSTGFSQGRRRVCIESRKSGDFCGRTRLFSINEKCGQQPR